MFCPVARCAIVLPLVAGSVFPLAIVYSNSGTLRCPFKNAVGYRNEAFLGSSLVILDIPTYKCHSHWMLTYAHLTSIGLLLKNKIW